MKSTRYIGLLSAVAMLLCGCGSDEIADVMPSAGGEGKSGEAVLMNGLLPEGLYIEKEEGAGPASSNAPRRIAVNPSSGKVSQWHDTDEISVSDGVLMYSYQAEPAEGEDVHARFVSKTSSSFTTSEDTGSEKDFYAFYPAVAVESWNGGVVTSKVYAEQKYEENVEGGIMGPYMASKATSTDGGQNVSFNFQSICSIIDVNVAGLGKSGNVESVSVYANNQVSITGKIQYDASTKKITVISNDAIDHAWSTQSEVATVRLASPKPASEVGTVRLYVLPVKIAGGVTITVRMTDGTCYSKHTTADVGSSTDTELTQTGVKGGTVVKPYYKKYNFGAFDISNSVYSLNDWMATIPGNIKFTHLSIPGTHDAATKNCTAIGTSAYTKCQDYTIAEQLEKGCRALDLRPYYNSSSLEIYHGNYGTGVTLANALDAVVGFLTSHPTETVFVLIHQEGGSSGNTNWMNRVWSCVNNYTAHIAKYGWNGNLNPCRGKMVVIFRDPYAGGTNQGDLGCGKVGWGSSFGPKTVMTGNASATSSNYTLYYQDEYDTTNASTKIGNLEKMLTEYIAKNETNHQYIYVNNTNIAGSTITTLAKNVNHAVLASNVFKNHGGRFGIMFTDYLFSSDQYGDQMYDLIRNQNYKYVYQNRTRFADETTSGTDTEADVSSDEYADGGEVYVKARN